MKLVPEHHHVSAHANFFTLRFEHDAVELVLVTERLVWTLRKPLFQEGVYLILSTADMWATVFGWVIERRVVMKPVQVGGGVAGVERPRITPKLVKNLQPVRDRYGVVV